MSGAKNVDMSKLDGIVDMMKQMKIPGVDTQGIDGAL
jgi:hypothetical protein